MYKKGAALELQFSSARLNNGAGDPYWIDLTAQEAMRLHAELGAFLAKASMRRRGRSSSRWTKTCTANSTNRMVGASRPNPRRPRSRNGSA